MKLRLGIVLFAALAFTSLASAQTCPDCVDADRAKADLLLALSGAELLHQSHAAADGRLAPARAVRARGEGAAAEVRRDGVSTRQPRPRR